MTGRWACPVFMLIVAISPSTVQAESPPPFLLMWGSCGTGPGQFDLPRGIGMDGVGTVYVAEGTSRIAGATPRIQVFTSTGGWIGEWQLDGAEPSALAVDGNGDVFVAVSHDMIRKYTSSGALVTQWGGGGAHEGAFNSPNGIAVDPDGYVYVADSQNHRIQKFTNDGVFVTKWGTLGAGDGQLASPTGVATDGAGFVYVADQDNRRVVKFTDNGVFVTQWGSDPDFYPQGVAVDDGANVFVLESINCRVQKFTSTGVFLTIWGGADSGDGQFNLPLGIAVDAEGSVFIADSGNCRVQKFGLASTPTTIATWGRIKATYR